MGLKDRLASTCLLVLAVLELQLFAQVLSKFQANFPRDRVCLGTQAAVTSTEGDLGGIPQPLDLGAQEMGSAESTEQTAPAGHPVSLGLPCVEMPGK